MNYKKAISRVFSKATGIPVEKALSLIERPPDPKLGDFSIPCFTLCAKGQSPAEKASLVAERIERTKGIKKIEAIGGYVNFFVDGSMLAGECIKEILSQRENYGRSTLGREKNVMIEYSAPNTNKPLHVGHLRNDCIGMGASRLFEFHGYRVIKANLVNDRGIHICQAMLAYKKYGQGKTPESEGVKGDKFVGDYYVKFNEESKKNPELNDEAIEMLRKWEQRDPETRKLWKKMRSWVLKGFRETYKKFGSEFDEIFYESQFYDKAKPIIELGLKKGVFEKNEEGAVVARLKQYGLPDKTVLRADGTSIYISNDLVLTKHKEEKFKLYKNIFCIASEQELYLKQLFKIMELLGFPWYKNLEHLSYGLVFLPGGKMKSREGKVIDADDLIASVEELAAGEVKKRFPRLPEREVKKRAEKIALAAIKFSMLRTDHRKNFTFVPEESVSFEGESGPYLQYTYARAKSILRKARPVSPDQDFTLLTSEKEKEIAKTLSLFSETLHKALENRALHILCHYLLELAGLFNAYYHETRVIGSAEKEAPRLALVEAVSLVLKSGLSILNIPALEEM